MDVGPRTPDTLGFAGRAFDRHAVIGPTLAKAAESGKPVASDPLPLLRKDGPIGFVPASAFRRRAPPSRWASSPFPMNWRR